MSVHMSNSELLEKIFIFVEALSPTPFYPYQSQFAKRVIRSVITNDGEELTALFARQSGKTETIARVTAGLMIILPKLANMPMFQGDKRLEMFKRGFWVGIFAPITRQAQITYNRLRGALMNKHAEQILIDPEINITFDTNNGQTVALSNGSFVSAISASEGSNIEGESFMMIICEECLIRGTKITTVNGTKNIEDVKVGDIVLSYNHKTGIVEPKKVTRSFSQPLFGRKQVNVKLSNGKTLKCTDNHPLYLEEKGYVRADKAQVGDLMLSYTHTTQYGDDNFVESNDTRIHDGGCVDSVSRQEVFQESKVGLESFIETNRLCDDEIREHQTVLSTGTKNSSKSGERESSLQNLYSMSSSVQKVPQIMLQERNKNSGQIVAVVNERRSSDVLVSGRWERYNKGKVNDFMHSCVFSLGERINSSLVEKKIQNNSRNYSGQKNKQTISKVPCDREEQVPFSFSREGSSEYAVQDIHKWTTEEMRNLSEGIHSVQIDNNSLLERVQTETTEGIHEGVLSQVEIIEIEISDSQDFEVFDLTVEDNHNFFAEDVLVHNCQDISNYKIRKSIHPMGAAYNATLVKIGTATTFKGDFYDAIQRNINDYKEKKKRKNHFEYNYLIVQKYNPAYAKYIEKEKYRLGEDSDEFQMAYNLKWILQRGMFVTPDRFDKLCNENVGRVFFDKYHNHVVGIDIGKSQDSTVVTVGEVDWENPVIVEHAKNISEFEDYVAYNVTIKDWLEIYGDDHEEQYYAIKDFLNNFNIARIVVDATGKGGPVADRIAANFDCEVIPFVFNQPSKSDLYKHLNNEFRAGRVMIPGDDDTRDTLEFRNFQQQFLDLQKTWRGNYMVVAHPEERGAHDDYADSCALMVYGSKDPGVSRPETSANPFSKKDSLARSYYRSRNAKTARRR